MESLSQISLSHFIKHLSDFTDSSLLSLKGISSLEDSTELLLPISISKKRPSPPPLASFKLLSLTGRPTSATSGSVAWLDAEHGGDLRDCWVLEEGEEESGLELSWRCAPPHQHKFAFFFCWWFGGCRREGLWRFLQRRCNKWERKQKDSRRPW